MKKNKGIIFIHIRYLLPPVLMLLLLAAMFIPSYEYVVAGKLTGKASMAYLLDSSFSSAKETIFAVTEQSAANLMFFKIVFGLIIAFVVLWICAFAVAIYSASVQMKYFWGKDEQDIQKSRTLFITFFPNRIFLCIVEALVLPLSLFPYILIPMYDKILGIRVSILLRAPDLLICTAVVIVVIAILSAVSVPLEKRLKVDLFEKNKRVELKEKTEEYQQVELNAEQKEKIAEKNANIRNIFGNKDD